VATAARANPHCKWLELEAASPKEADEKDLNEVALGVGVLVEHGIDVAHGRQRRQPRRGNRVVERKMWAIILFVEISGSRV
jgi:hypothetical protein